MRAVWLVLVLGQVTAQEPRKEFKLDQLIRIRAENQDQLEILKSVERDNKKLDFWQPPVSVQVPVDVQVPHSALNDLNQILQTNNITSEILIPDLQEKVDSERSEMEFNREKDMETKKFNLGAYHTLNEINQWMDELVLKNPDLVTKIQIGLSFEKRPMFVLKFSKGYDRPAAWIESGASGREWISVATAVWIANMISTDRSLYNLLSYMDILLVIVANPDGYVYSHNVDRLWSKTRSTFGRCRGVNLNRNWVVPPSTGHFPLVDPCSSWFPGPFSFSEVEVKNMAAFIQKHGNIQSFISLQAYSQSLMFPYGFNCSKVLHYDELYALGQRAVSKLSSLYGTPYAVGSLCNIHAEEASSCIDWAYEHGIKYSFVLELRDKGDYRYLLPYHQIIPTATETWEALKHIMKHARDHFGIHMDAAAPIPA